MKQVILVLLAVFSLHHLAWAQSTQTKRRIEEEKRLDLVPSESYQIKIDETASLNSTTDQDAYFSQLLTQETVSLSDGYRMVLVLMGMDGQYKDPSAQFNFLNGEGILPASVGENPDPDAPLRKGAAAYMLAKVMDIKGGVTLHLFGINRRYALKELVYQGIMFPGNGRDVMSGRELILTLTRAADYLAEREKKP